MPRLKGSADLLEDRRQRALALLDSGYSLNEVGRRIGCNASSVMRWRDTRRRDKISVTSGVSVSPKRQQLGLYYLLYFDNIGQEEPVCVRMCLSAGVTATSPRPGHRCAGKFLHSPGGAFEKL